MCIEFGFEIQHKNKTTTKKQQQQNTHKNQRLSPTQPNIGGTCVIWNVWVFLGGRGGGAELGGGRGCFCICFLFSFNSFLFFLFFILLYYIIFFSNHNTESKFGFLLLYHLRCKTVQHSASFTKSTMLVSSPSSSLSSS